jgi:tetratricopeptide (TPR) repeat protein
VLLTLGLLAKPMLVTLPILLLLLDFWPLERLRRRGDLLVLLREKIPLFAISLLIGVVTLLAQQSGGALRSNVDIPLLARFANAIGSYGLYVANTLWPTALSVLYPHPNLPGGVPWDPWQVAGIAGGLVAASILFLRLGGFAATGWLWFVVGLAPVIGLLQAGEQGMADRYLYLPGIGLYLLAVWGGHALLARRFDTSTVRSLGAAIALVALAACSILTARQAACWRDSITLFTHSLRVAPGSYTLHNNLGNALHDQALFEEAIEQYRLSLSIHAGYVPAHLNLARTLEARGESAAAAEHFLRGRGVDPLSARGQLVLGGALFRDGDLAGAEAHFERARELEPQWHSPHLTLGRELLNRRETGRALTHLKEAVRLEPESASAAISMAATLQASGDLEGAISEYARAARLDPSSAAAHTGLALALAATGDSQRAAESAARARELEPDSREIDTLLEAESL